MFETPPFHEVINGFSLKFYAQKLEAYYQRNSMEEYMRGKLFNFIVLGSLTALVFIILYSVRLDYADGYTKQAHGGIVAASLISGGTLMELLIRYVDRLKFMRNAVFAFCSMLASASLIATAEYNLLHSRAGYVLHS